jgi:hypothetical protein
MDDITYFNCLDKIMFTYYYMYNDSLTVSLTCKHYRYIMSYNPPQHMIYHFIRCNSIGYIKAIINNSTFSLTAHHYNYAYSKNKFAIAKLIFEAINMLYGWNKLHTPTPDIFNSIKAGIFAAFTMKISNNDKLFELMKCYSDDLLYELCEHATDSQLSMVAHTLIVFNKHELFTRLNARHNIHLTFIDLIDTNISIGNEQSLQSQFMMAIKVLYTAPSILTRSIKQTTLDPYLVNLLRMYFERFYIIGRGPYVSYRQFDIAKHYNIDDQIYCYYTFISKYVSKQYHKYYQLDLNPALYGKISMIEFG